MVPKPLELFEGAPVLRHDDDADGLDVVEELVGALELGFRGAAAQETSDQLREPHRGGSDFAATSILSRMR